MDLRLCLSFRCFTSPTPISFSADIDVNNPFFAAHDHTLQKWIVFFAFDELIADAHIRQMNFFQLMRCTQTSSFFTKPSDFKWPWTLPTDTFRTIASSRTVECLFACTNAFISSSSILEGLSSPERWAFLIEKSLSRNRANQFWHFFDDISNECSWTNIAWGIRKKNRMAVIQHVDFREFRSVANFRFVGRHPYKSMDRSHLMFVDDCYWLIQYVYLYRL